MMFRTTLTHVLTEEFTGDAGRDATAVKDALCRGRCYMGYHVTGDPTGFRFFALANAGRIEMGDTACLTRGIVFRVELPDAGEVRLIANGKIVGCGSGRFCEFTAANSGPHRVEVRRRRVPWIFSNHIYLT